MNIPIGQASKIFADAKKKCTKACIATVNIQAAQARKNAIQNIQNEFTLRNSWTLRNIRFTQCPSTVTDISQIESEVGATDKIPYMERQEKGGQHEAKTKRLPIPMTQARGGNNKKQVLKKFRLSTIGIVHGEISNPLATTRKSQYVARAFVAFKNNLLLTSGKNFFQVSNFVKNGNKISFKQTPIYNVKFESTQTPATPWLEPATQIPKEDGQEIFNQQMDKISLGG